MFVDAHNHLQDPAFAPDRSEVVTRAREVGVTTQVVCGTSPQDWDRVRALAVEHPDLLPCYGLHPWFVGPEESVSWVRDLERLLRQDPRAGVGEIGLDRWVRGYDIDRQLRAFRHQWDLAVSLDRPIVIHCLKAWDLLLDELNRLPRARRLMVHGFGGPCEMIGPLQRAGAYLSVAGNVLAPRRHRAHTAVAAIPPERLLVETDAPDMPPPEPLRLDPASGRNEPAHLPAILRGLADLREMPPDRLAAHVLTNARRFWEIPAP